MYAYSTKSKRKLETCHPELQRLFNVVGGIINTTIIEGARTEKTQTEYFNLGKSKVYWPYSKHNPKNKVGGAIETEEDFSYALDASPWPIIWEGDTKDIARFYFFAGIVKGVAKVLEIKIRWGGDWDNDNDFKDQTFDDLVHFELIKRRSWDK
jgi:peptidoglycan L-alanyl-D-glutamate endopeptidase CwlK